MAVLGSSTGCELLMPDYEREEPRPEVVDVDMGLRDVGRIEPQIEVIQDEAHPSKFSLGVRLVHGMNPQGRDGALCPRFLDLVATLDGNLVPMGMLGGWTSDRYPECRMPSLLMVIRPPVSSSSVLTFGDSTKTISLALGDRLHRRTATLVDPPVGGYRPGESMSVRWSHGDDLATTPKLTVRRMGQWFTIGAGSVSREGATLTFPLPKELVSGPHTLNLSKNDNATGCGEACSISDLRVVDVLFDVRAP